MRARVRTRGMDAVFISMFCENILKNVPKIRVSYKATKKARDFRDTMKKARREIVRRAVILSFAFDK